MQSGISFFSPGDYESLVDPSNTESVFQPQFDDLVIPNEFR